MELNKIIKKALNEALGVPDNILNVANAVFDDLVKLLEPYQSIDDLTSDTHTVTGDFYISDFKFNKVKFRIKCENVNNFDIVDKENLVIDLAGLQVQNTVKLTKNLTIKQNNKPDSPILITLRFVISDKTTVNDIKDFIIKERPKLVGSFTHELKHKYDNFKKFEGNMKSRVRYEIHSNNNFARIRPLNMFIHNIYFVHTIEGLVRPSEVASLMDTNKVTKKNFYDFITNDVTYKKLKEINEFSYDNLKNELRSYIPQIKEVFVLADMKTSEYENISDDEMIDKILDLLYTNICNWSLQSMFDRLSVDPMQSILKSITRRHGIEDDDDDDDIDIEKRDLYFQKYKKEILKYRNNVRGYYDHEEKLFKFVSERMMKKLAKLYAMARENQNESITNPDLWYRYIIKEVKIEKNFNFEKKLPKKTKK